VGGYTNLASIAPVDVYKGDQKVSEAKNPAGAIISAWMREGQNIGQAQKNTALPEGYSTVANTTDERRDKTVANFLIDRLKKIDRELERYYKRDLMERIFDVLDKSRPKSGQSGVKRSTLGADTQKFADMVYRSSLLDDEKTAERLTAIEAQITSTEGSGLVRSTGVRRGIVGPWQSSLSQDRSRAERVRDGSSYRCADRWSCWNRPPPFRPPAGE
jgi:hypothetical protein